WGHDFRPEYRQLVAVRDRFPGAVCLALTATATPRVRSDIKSSLRFEESNEFIASFNRENLLIEVVPKADPTTQTLQFIQRFSNQSGIIYCFSRRQVDELAAVLQNKGYSVRPYHAGLTDEERKQNQELFIRDDVQIIVATIAFGMGINKPNVRFIVHYDLPKSIESYYQEIGRAGRDGLQAHCLLLYSYADIQKIKYFIDQKEEHERQAAYLHLNALIKYAESDICRRVPLLDYFGEKFVIENCAMCDNCLAGEKTRVDITIPVQKFLSCVKRTGERFGAGHVSDVLMGSENQKVLKFGHQSLSTFGIGKDLSKKQWMHISRQLIQKGYLSQDDQYGSLGLTPKAYELFKSSEPVMGFIQAEAPAAKKRKAAETEYDQALFDLLKKKRKELADAGGLPPYIIFSDKTLVEMATYYPMSPASLLTMNGVGAVKLEKYGNIFLAVIQSYCEEHNLVELPKRKAAEPAAPGQLELKPRYMVVGEAYNQGQSVQALVERFSVSPATIQEHLSKFVQDGNTLRSVEDLLSLSSLSPDQQEAVMAAFDKVGAERLKPVFEELNETVSYDEIKVLRIVYISRLNETKI
ncbi:MAG: RecQ family ATP-dependent DNA helicase, partial [Chloroflexota bacterium]